jgi:hypothetical protein
VIATGIAMVLLSLIFWGILGANTGWTKSYIEIPRKDEITGIDYTEKVNRFVPGVGFVCIFAGIVILKRKSHPNAT